MRSWTWWAVTIPWLSRSAAQTIQDTTQVYTPQVSTTKERTPPATTKERAMHTHDLQSGGVIAPHTQANVAGRDMLDHQDARWRGGSVGPPAMETPQGVWWTA